MTGPDETALVGGAGAGLVRVADTVRRPAGPSSAAVRELLLHLEAVGFEGAPRHLGVDERDRDVLTFVEGDAPLPPYPPWALTDGALDDPGRLLRRSADDAWLRTQRSALLVPCRNDAMPSCASGVCERVWPWRAVLARAMLEAMTQRRLVCLIGLHDWVRRRTDDGAGEVQACRRCGKVDDRPDMPDRFRSGPTAP